MGYDEYGNYVDDEDGLLYYEEQEKMKEWEANERIAAKVYQKRAAQAEQKFMGDSWQEALKDAGLTQEEYNVLVAEDPAYVQNVVRENMKATVSSVKTRPRGAHGHFISNAEAARRQPGQMQEPGQEPRQSTDYYKEKSKKGPLTSQDELDMVDAAIGKMY